MSKPKMPSLPKTPKVKSLINKSLPTVTPITKRNGLANATSPNMALPQAPMNQTPPSFGGADGIRRRRMGAQMQRAIIKRKGK